MSEKCFLDASVIADFLILEMTLKSKENINDRLKLLSKREKDNPQLFYSHQLLSYIKRNQKDKFEFLTSSLSISEVISVIHDKLCIDKMYEQGIPLKYWFKYKRDFNLEKRGYGYFNSRDNLLP